MTLICSHLFMIYFCCFRVRLKKCVFVYILFMEKVELLPIKEGVLIEEVDDKNK